LKRFTIIVLVAAILAGLAFGLENLQRERREPIKVGLLHSLSGTMAISETSVVEASLLAIEEINAQGGVLGRPIEPMVVDIESDWDLAARQAEALITEEGVAVIFGCWTSACRKTVKPVFEKHDHLLIYPVQYEGLEASPNIIYTGAAPNQQLVPAVNWSLENLGRRFYLVGSDYVFPRTANAILRAQIEALGGEVVGEDYIPLGSTEVEAIVTNIALAEPDVILNTINGDSNIAFFAALRAQGITPQLIPTISFSIAEPELQTMNIPDMVGDYAAWNYFQSLPGPENERFVAAFRARYGQERVISDPMEAAYFGVYLWAQAVEEAGTSQLSRVQVQILNQSRNAPSGVVYIDPQTRHTWKSVLIGQIQADGQFEIVWTSERPVRPLPYPPFRSRDAWEAFLLDLYEGWGGQWALPTGGEG
jgi:urea transport system substrate-binding protein